MKNENEIIVGLDIGTTKIACCIGRRGDNDKVILLGFGKTESVGVVRGAVKNIVSTADSIRKAVRQASEQAQFDVQEVYVGIAGQHIKSVQKQGSITIPESHHQITDSDIERLKSEQRCLMLGPGEEVIHIFPQKFYVDGELLDGVNPVGVVGNLLQADFHIVTGNVREINNIYESVEAAGLKVKGMVLEPVASAYAVLDDQERTAGVTLVDIGGGTTDVAIFHESVICHTSVLPCAGITITEDIRRGCNIMRNQAESLKTKFGCCLPGEVSENDVISIPGIHGMAPHEISMKGLASIINARAKVILELVAAEIQESRLERSLIAGVVITGGGAKLKHIKSLSELITATDTRIGTPDEHIDSATNPIIIDEIKHPMYSTCVGLVLYGLEELNACLPAGDTPDPEQVSNETQDLGSNTDPIDIFKDFPSDPKPVSEPVSEPEPAPKAAPKRKKWSPSDAISRFLDRLTNDGIDE